MPEGHTLHRLAHDLSAAFGGQVVRVSSPQGRFADAAALLDRTELKAAEAWGKHLFVEFAGERIVHVHLGLIGTFAVHPDVPEVPLPVGQVRLRVSTGSTSEGVSIGSTTEGVSTGSAGDTAYADLRGATTCELLTPAQRDLVVARQGPDPLRADADPDRAWDRIRRSRTSIGALLMDQAVLAGVGNVYRAEVLFRHRLHPHRPGNALPRARFDALWADLVELMHEGVRTGRIDTVRPEHTPEAMGRPPRVDDHGGEVYVYRRTGQPCLVCTTTVRTEVLNGRNLFWCPRCQRPYRPRTVK